MQILQEMLPQTVSDIWSSLLSLEVVELPGDTELEAAPTFVGCVHLIGGVSGMVAIMCGESLARQAAARMFDLDEADVADADIRDAVGELANVAAGNLKAALPDPYKLSMPSVVTGSDFQTDVLNGQQVAQTIFGCSAGQFVVSVFEQEEGSRRKR
ncbi:MAG: chemotaxis protein CheX [Gemmatimonas sp.]